MVLGIECSGLESTSASEMVANHSEILSNSDETKIENKGISNPEAERNQYEALEVVNSPPLVVAETSSPSPSPATAKGKGLKKWKRLKRDVNLDGGGNMDNGKPLKRGLSNLPTDVDKPVKFSAEQKQTSEGSASSSNAMWKDFSVSVDHFGGNADSGSAAGPILAAGTDSENSEDHSSKSTAASAPKMRHEVREKNKMKSVSGKKLATSLHKGHQGKPRTDTSKKQKGEQVKIEKENSHSSLESDSRTSHVVYGQGNNSATSNGRQRGKSMISGEETSDEGHGVEQELSEDPQAGSSRKNGVFEVTSADINGSPIDLDPLVESIMLLQSVQQELEKEVEKFRDIGKEENIQEEISEQLESGELAQESAELVQESADILGIEVVNLKETVKDPSTNEDTDIELERLFKQKIEAEVEFLAITKTVQKMRGAVGEQIKIFEQQKSKQVNMLEKLEDAEQKAEKLKGQTEKIVTFYEDITNTDESLKLKSNVWKYASFFLLQLVLFVFILAVFLWQSGPYPADFVPT